MLSPGQRRSGLRSRFFPFSLGTSPLLWPSALSPGSLGYILLVRAAGLAQNVLSLLYV